MIDEIYDKYCHIIYKWSETVRVNVTVRVYAERKAEHSDDMYYVYGIGVSDFLEPDKYDRVEQTKYYKEGLSDEAYEDFLKISGVLYGNNYISLDDLNRLNNELKEAGAKEVFLHPSFYMSSDPFFIYPMPESDEVRNIMYHNAKHMPMHHNDEMLIVIHK